MTIQPIESSELDAIINEQTDKPSILYIWAIWCQPCKMLSPVMADLAKDYSDKANFLKLDADTATDILQKYGVSSVPTLLVFKGGDVVHSVTGAKPKPGLLKELADFL